MKLSIAEFKQKLVDLNEAQYINRLAIFDWDSTLFRSPLPNPALWSKELCGTLIGNCHWFADSRTLQHPYVPLHPDISWWDESILKEAESCMKSQSGSR